MSTYTQFMEQFGALPESQRPAALRRIAAEVGVSASDAYAWAYLGKKPAQPVLSPTPVTTERGYMTRAQAAQSANLDGEDLPDYGRTSEVDRYAKLAVFVEHMGGYIVPLGPSRSPIFVTKESHESVVRQYSNVDGYPISATEIARDLGITPREFGFYTRAFGMRRDMLPVSAEQVANMTEDQLSEVSLSMREAGARRKLEDAARKQDAADADKYRRIGRFFSDVLSPALQAVPVYDRPPAIKASGDEHLIIPLNDWQVGAYARGERLRFGREFSKEAFAESIDEYVAELYAYVERNKVQFGRPTVVLCGDLLHGLTGFTVHGTALHKHMDSFDHEQFAVALAGLVKVADAVIDLFGHYDLVAVAGNHEGALTQALGHCLKQRHAGRVDYNPTDCRTAFRMVGNSFFMFDHGATPDSGSKGGKIARSGSQMYAQVEALANSRPDMLGKARSQGGGVYFVMGDQHHALDESGTGVEIIKLPALPRGDAYADENIWHSRAAQAVFHVGPKGVRHMERFYL